MSNLAKPRQELITAARQEWPRMLLQVILSSIAFTLALVINSAIQRHAEDDTFSTMMNSVYIELWLNRSALQEIKNADNDRIIVEGLQSRTTASCLSNPMFVRHLTKEQYMYLSGFVGGAETMNSYRALAEKYILSDRPDKEERLRYLRQEWNRGIGIMENGMNELLKGQSPPR
ncbi:MAG TPA: hypothetical protein VK763_20165 [Terriglobales bacterium]|jgi:hypothetical protein|nr:hypothetical protein [Terriglobales bacterium]